MFSSGFKIPHIENLGVTNDEYEVLDLSDNEVARLENFPRLVRCTALLLNSNRINKIQLDLHHNLPNLDTLVGGHTNKQSCTLTTARSMSLHGPIQRLTGLSFSASASVCASTVLVGPDAVQQSSGHSV